MEDVDAYNEEEQAPILLSQSPHRPLLLHFLLLLLRFVLLLFLLPGLFPPPRGEGRGATRGPVDVVKVWTSGRRSRGVSAIARVTSAMRNRFVWKLDIVAVSPLTLLSTAGCSLLTETGAVLGLRAGNYEYAPVNSLLGGLLVNDVIKAISGEGTPHYNFVFYSVRDNSCVIETLGVPIFAR